jgi:hypothetical protein
MAETIIGLFKTEVIHARMNYGGMYRNVRPHL